MVLMLILLLLVVVVVVVVVVVGSFHEILGRGGYHRGHPQRPRGRERR